MATIGSIGSCIATELQNLSDNLSHLLLSFSLTSEIIKGTTIPIPRIATTEKIKPVYPIVNGLSHNITITINPSELSMSPVRPKTAASIVRINIPTARFVDTAFPVITA